MGVPPMTTAAMMSMTVSPPMPVVWAEATRPQDTSAVTAMVTPQQRRDEDAGLCHADAGDAGGLRVAADGDDVAAELGAAEDDGPHGDKADHQDDREGDGPQIALAHKDDALVQVADGRAVAQQHQGALEDLLHGERHQKGRQLEFVGDKRRSRSRRPRPRRCRRAG